MKLDKDIATLNLEPIAFKGCIDEKWSVSEVDKIEENYRQWLQLIRDYPGKLLAPTRAVDCFWHHHILDTRKYMRDCELLFGEYVHHFPYSGLRSAEDAAIQSARLDRTKSWMKLMGTSNS